MKEYRINSWEEYPQVVNDIRKRYGSHQTGDITQENTIIYRGQADAQWRLRSTLERYSSSPWTIETYAKCGGYCATQIESFTDKIWNLPPANEIENEIKQKSNITTIHIPKYCYEYWIYLRHHLFPSPLLDWTLSPYIAAFFALADQSSAEEAAIFAYIETPMGRKGGWGGAPQITPLGPYVRTHRRHFLQQSYYTICTTYKNKSHEFTCHEKVFEQDQEDQDVLIKITMSRSERLKALSSFNEMNISHFSLFQSEEALMKTLAFKEIGV